MKTPSTTFRLEKKIIKMMDRLITNPPPVCIDDKLGHPRNRTELVEVLVKKAAECFEEKAEAAK